MSLRPNGSYCCDRCGVDVGNAGIDRAASITDLDPERPGSIRRLHLCLDRVEDGRKVQGCRDRVLTRKALRNHVETRTTA